MVHIKDGGKTSTLKGKIATISISLPYRSRTFEMWINNDSLSYLTVKELLDLKDEVTNALKELLK